MFARLHVSVFLACVQTCELCNTVVAAMQLNIEGGFFLFCNIDAPNSHFKHHTCWQAKRCVKNGNAYAINIRTNTIECLYVER